MNPTFQDLASLFPAVLAPALVAHLRRRWPALDGGLVWLAVVLAAVLFSLAIAALFGQAPSLALVRQGVLLGAGAAAAHTVATGRPSAKPVQPEPLAPGQIRATAPPGSSVTIEAVLTESGERPAAGTRIAGPTPARSPVVEPSTSWGPAPSGSGS